MKKKILMMLVICLVACASFGILNRAAYADEPAVSTGTSISLSPVSKILQIAPGSTYDESLEIKNNGDKKINIEVYSAPYSYVYSEEEDLYKLGFSNENNFTQISRWITFENTNGEYVNKPTFSIEPNSLITIKYRVNTPADIPDGGQYAVIFAHTLSESTTGSGIRTEASPGMVIYGRSLGGETKISAEISNMKVERSITENNITRNNFYASAKVKNTGNVDFNATGVLKIDSIIGGGSYETPAGSSRISVIPESELVISDEWKETPSFGIYKATWTVTAGDTTDTIEQIMFLIPIWLIVLVIILLTILTIWIIIVVRKRKERRSRLAV